MSETDKFEFQVAPESAGLRLDLFLKERLPDLSRSQIQKWIKRGAVLSDGSPAGASLLVKAGGLISLCIPEEEGRALPEAIDIPILYEDRHILVVNKPAGMLTHPTSQQWTGTLANAVAHRLAQEKKKNQLSGPRPGIVHRLDRETSGVLAAAKNVRALENIARQFRDREVEKIYRAVVWGRVQAERGAISGPIGQRQGESRMKITPAGRASQTDFKVIRRLANHTYLECYPKTGRTHQIRVHLAEIGHPVLGDSLYGPKEGREGRLMLHAYQLTFRHPATRKRVRFRAPLPKEFQLRLKQINSR